MYIQLLSFILSLSVVTAEQKHTRKKFTRKTMQLRLSNILMYICVCNYIFLSWPI